MKNARFGGCVVLSFFLILIMALTSCQNQREVETKAKIRFSAVYFDVHGTLLDSEYHVRPATISALQRFQNCGGKIGIATGGTLDQIQPYRMDIGPNLPIVLLNGALVLDPDSIKATSKAVRAIKATFIDPSVASVVVEKTRLLPTVRGIILQNDDSAVVDRDDPPFLKALKHFGISSYKVDKGLAHIADYHILEIIVEVQKDQGGAVRDVILPHVAGKAEATISGPYSVDVVASGISKAGAVVESLRSSSIEPMESLAFGDGDNDAEMLASVGVGVAMRNCSPATCKAAVIIIGDNNSDAIAQFFEKFVLTPDCQ